MIWTINKAISFHHWRLFLIHCILNFSSASSSIQPQPSFVFLQLELPSATTTLKVRNKVLLSKTKLNFIKTKTTRTNFSWNSTNIISLSNIHFFINIYLRIFIKLRRSSNSYLIIRSQEPPGLIRNCFFKFKR